MGARDGGLPVCVEGITPAWLTRALASRVPGVEVASISVDETLWGTGTKVLISLEYNDAGKEAGLPASLCVKGGFADHRELMAYIYATETRFYRDVAPQLDVRVPQCFFAATDAAAVQSIVILEDLRARGAGFCRVQRPLGFEQAAANLDSQARLHARWWNHPDLADPARLGWLWPLDPMPDGPDGAYQRGQLEPEVWSRCMALPRGVAVPKFIHDRERMAAALQQLRRLDRTGPMCLLHSDPHLGNMYFDADGAAGFLDWQSVRRGPWHHDFTYFLVSALDIADRRRWDRALLAYYLERLRAYGVADVPGFDTAWDAYRQQIIYGLYFWLVNPEEFQAEVNNCAVAPRFAMAALDLDAFSALEALA